MTHPRYTIRPVRPEDVPAVVAMVHELALFERAPDQCRLTVAQLRSALFADHPALFGHIAVGHTAVDDTGEPVGFALWYLNYSTWEGAHGIHLEDLFVRPEARGTGAGRALLAQLAARCVERGYRRLDWRVLQWNPARDFYATLGSHAMPEWLQYRLEGHPLHTLAGQAGPSG